MTFNKNEIMDYESRIEEMEKKLAIMTKETCLFIFATLMIRGRMSYEEIKKSTDLGKATIFRNLDLLMKAELVKKEKDQTIEDRRKNSYYYVSKGEIRFPKIDKEFVNYLKSVGKIHLIEEANKNQNTLSNTLFQAIMSKPTKIDDEKRLKQFSFVTLIELSKAPDIEKKIVNFINDIQEQLKEKERDFKEGLKNPAVVRIDFSSRTE